jgi:hypothetical protein
MMSKLTLNIPMSSHAWMRKSSHDGCLPMTIDQFIWDIFLAHYDVYLTAGEIDKTLFMFEQEIRDKFVVERNKDIATFSDFNHDNIISAQALEKFKSISDELPIDLVTHLLHSFGNDTPWNPKLSLGYGIGAVEDVKKYAADQLEQAEYDLKWQVEKHERLKRDFYLFQKHLLLLERVLPWPKKK